MAKDHVLQVRVERIEMERLRLASKAWGLSVSNFVRMALKFDVAEQVLRSAQEVPHG